jgi:peptidoglycan/xylan/chitin deacetylase (PgdA/CDA1 family)
MKSTSEALKRMARRGVGSRWLRASLTLTAAKLGRAMILVYHRVGDDRGGRTELVPRVQPSTLRTHIRVLRELGNIIPLADLLDGSLGGTRPRFALTFDDDYPSHATEVLPILTSLGVRGTFFLSGRGPLGLGPHWFELLEEAVDEDGVTAVAARLDPSSTTVEDLALACERDLDRQRLLRTTTKPRSQPLDANGIISLAQAGMTVGFHTLHHVVLTDLDDESVRRALEEGRSDLDRLTGSRATFLAYPHGKADQRTARLVESAGYRAGFTGVPIPIRGGSNRFLLGRWEPGDVDEETFARGLVLRLLRSAEIPRPRRRL